MITPRRSRYGRIIKMSKRAEQAILGHMLMMNDDWLPDADQQFILSYLTDPDDLERWQEEREDDEPRIAYSWVVSDSHNEPEPKPESEDECSSSCDCTDCQRTRPCECGECDVVGGSCESSDEEEVYAVVKNVDAFCGDHAHLQKFKRHSTEWIKQGDPPEGDYRTTYFRTYGGGPEGGYFLRIFSPLNGFDPTHEVYRVERNWGEPFSVKKIDGILDYNEYGNGNAGTIRLVKKSTP